MWFTVTCYRSFGSLNENDETQKPKKNLFLFMGVFFGIWIISLPIVEYVGLLLDPWVRWSFVVVSQRVVALVLAVEVCRKQLTVWARLGLSICHSSYQSGGHHCGIFHVHGHCLADSCRQVLQPPESLSRRLQRSRLQCLVRPGLMKQKLCSAQGRIDVLECTSKEGFAQM